LLFFCGGRFNLPFCLSQAADATGLCITGNSKAALDIGV
jgi:hypothetical protein